MFQLPIQTCENKCVEKGVQFNESHCQCKTADIQIDASTSVEYTADIQIDASTSSMSVDVTDLVVDWIKLLYYRKMSQFQSVQNYFRLPPFSKNNMGLYCEMSRRGRFVAILRHFQALD